MKQISLLIALCSILQVCFSQKPMRAGITVEGGYFFPEDLSKQSADLKNGYAAGVGVWLMKELHRRFSVDLGMTFRQKKFDQVHPGSYSPYSEELPGTSSPGRTIEFNQDLLAVPLHIRVFPSKKFFLTTGIEHAFILNPQADLKKKSEDNWMFGLGGQPGRFNWALTYTRGFQERRVVKKSDNTWYGTAYTNRILQLSLFYPIWQKK